MLIQIHLRKEWLSWVMVVLWTLLIYATIPLANQIQDVWVRLWGRDSLFLIVVAILLLSAVVALVAVGRADRNVRRSQYLWIVAVFSAYIYFVSGLKALPAEALHFIEYGVLSALTFLAFRHRVGDSAIYLITAVFCLLIGTVDEIIQWTVPQRFWDFRDVWLNGLGGDSSSSASGRDFRRGLFADIGVRLPQKCSYDSPPLGDPAHSVCIEYARAISLVHCPGWISSISRQ